MRIETKPTKRGFVAMVFSGTHTILIALNCPDAARKGLKGFSFECQIIGPGKRKPKFLRSQKVFRSVVPDPKNARDPKDNTKPMAFYTDQFPVQSFLWGDYAVSPDTTFRLKAFQRSTFMSLILTEYLDEKGYLKSKDID